MSFFVDAVVDYNKGGNNCFKDIKGRVESVVSYVISKSFPIEIVFIYLSSPLHFNSHKFSTLWQIIGIIKVNKFHMLNVYVIYVVALICVNIYHIIKT